MGDQDALSTYDQIRLTLSSSYYTLRRALKLNRLRDLLTQSALAPDAPIWLLGKEYAASPDLSHEEQESVRSTCTALGEGDQVQAASWGRGCRCRVHTPEQGGELHRLGVL